MSRIKNGTKSQFNGNSKKFELADILVSVTPPGETKQDIFSMLRNCFVFEKIDKICFTHY